MSNPKVSDIDADNVQHSATIYCIVIIIGILASIVFCVAGLALMVSDANMQITAKDIPYIILLAFSVAIVKYMHDAKENIKIHWKKINLEPNNNDINSRNESSNSKKDSGRIACCLDNKYCIQTVLLALGELIFVSVSFLASGQLIDLWINLGLERYIDKVILIVIFLSAIVFLIIHFFINGSQIKDAIEHSETENKAE